ncbi:MAG: DUF4157 domain-containing protein, partial [Nannocystaceae bacterium]
MPGRPSHVAALEDEADGIADRLLCHRRLDLPRLTPLPAATARGLAGGRVLPSPLRTDLEGRLGQDLSSVRIHLDSDHATRRGARAVACGEDIAFAPSAFDPGTTPGRRLLGHELAHVLQQRRAGRRRVMLAKERIITIVVNLATNTITFYLSSGRRITGSVVSTIVSVGDYQATYDRTAKAVRVSTARGVPVVLQYGLSKTDRAVVLPLLPAVSKVLFRVISRGPSAAQPSAATRPTSPAAPPPPPPPPRPGSPRVGGPPPSRVAPPQGRGRSQQPQPTTLPPTTAPAPAPAKTPITDDLIQKLGGKTGKALSAAERAALERKLSTLTDQERRDFELYAREASSEAGFDLESIVSLYTKLSPAEREVLRTNLVLRRDAATPDAKLPDKVVVAIETSAKQGKALQRQASKLNQQLARIRAKVTDPRIKAQLGSIDISKLHFFKEMMLLEGLLAGAAQRSPGIQGTARRLTSAIAGIRGWILREIRDLIIELGLTAVFSALTGGGGAVATGGRVAWVLWRLDKLRKLILRVESIYRTITTIRASIDAVVSGYRGFQSFQSIYRAKLATYIETLSKLRAAVDDGRLQAQLDAAEDDLLTWVLDALRNGKLEPLLDHLQLPSDMTEEQLLAVLQDIP